MKKKKRKIILSITIDPDIIADIIENDEDRNTSRFTEKALKFYIKHLVEKAKK